MNKKTSTIATIIFMVTILIVGSGYLLGHNSRILGPSSRQQSQLQTEDLRQTRREVFRREQKLRVLQEEYQEKLREEASISTLEKIEDEIFTLKEELENITGSSYYHNHHYQDTQENFYSSRGHHGPHH